MAITFRVTSTIPCRIRKNAASGMMPLNGQIGGPVGLDELCSLTRYAMWKKSKPE